MRESGKVRKKDKSLIPAYILTGYLFLMFCVYPFYYENGYYNIGIAKNNFFTVVSIISFICTLAAVAVCILDAKKRKRPFIEKKNISITQKLLLGYMVTVFISFVFSEYKGAVLWGSEGWYLGTIPMLLLAAFAFLTAHFWKDRKWILYGSIVVSGIVFFLGICNRFSFYPVAIEPPYPTFISTLGNINWFCGYMSVVSPVGIVLFILQENKRRWTTGLMALYVLISFMAGFCQGSSGVFLWNAALFAAMLWIAVRNTGRLKKWLLAVGLWGIAGQLVRALKYFLPDYYNYDSALLIDTNITLIIAAVTFIAFACLTVFVKEDKEFSLKIQKGCRVLIVLAVVLSVALWISVSVYNTNVGIPSLAESEIFLLNENWGNGRGASLKTAFVLFGEMTFIQKIFGVGADGFSAFAYCFPEVQEYLTAYFGESVLTNSHCEVVTNLVNLGIAGAVLYVAILLSFVYRAMKKGERQPLLYVFAVCVICYLVNNLISFAQILNIPFLFLLLGMGEYYLKEENER